MDNIELINRIDIGGKINPSDICNVDVEHDDAVHYETDGTKEKHTILKGGATY